MLQFSDSVSLFTINALLGHFEDSLVILEKLTEFTNKVL